MVDFKSRYIHEVVEAQTDLTPDRIAVVADDEAISYAMLDRRANCLSHRLRSRGVGPDTVVGVCVERSVDMLVGILGVLKSGGGYLPLDPAYPEEYLRHVSHDADLKLVVTNRRTHDLPGMRTWSEMGAIVALDDTHNEHAQRPEVSRGLSRNSLAYVIYTSGSTGGPRGVMVTHANVAHSMSARLVRYEPVDTLLLLPSFAFDASVAAIFWTLCTGGRLVLPAPRLERDLSEVAKIIAQHEVSHLLCVSSMYSAILEAATRDQLSTIRMAVVGGDACQPRTIARHREKTPQAALHNEYGPTECTVWSSAFDTSEFREDEVAVPIGRAIPNTHMHILGPNLEPMPSGAAGELYIGGPGVSKGYLNRPALTEASFITDPFSDDPGARLYKTGDLAESRADGNIVFLGRLDHQLKIRGFRVEPEEIESALLQHPLVLSAAVTAHGGSVSGGGRLVAYVVADGDGAPTPRDLRVFLRQRLPDFKVPSTFVFAESLPRTANGKVDRQALAPPAYQRQRVETPGSLSPVELELQQIWEDTLQVGPIGIDDDFFDIGGHSLLAAQVLTRIERWSGKRLALGTLLEASTIRELARRLTTEPDSQSRQASWLIPVQPAGSRLALFCVPGEGQTALHYGPLARHIGPDQSVFALAADPASGRGLPGTRIEDIASRYVDEIRTIQPEGPYLLAGNSFGGLIAYEMARQLEMRGSTVGLLALFDTPRPAPRVRRYWRLVGFVVRRIGHYLRQFACEAQKWIAVGGGLRGGIRFLKIGVPKPSHVEAAATPTAGNDAGFDYATRISFLRYVPKIYRGHLTLFRAEHGKEHPDRILLGWGELVRSSDVYVVAGGHMTLLREPYVGSVAELLQTCLDRVTRNE